MDFLLLIPVALFLLWTVKGKQQQKRIGLLAGHLANYSIEKNIETLAQGYLRALGASDPGREEQVWAVLRTTEQALCRQVRQLADEFARVDGAVTRVSKLPLWLPGASSFAGSFDLREALQVHARGICRAVEADAAGAAKGRAFAISAEMLLMQHTCHWFCRSKALASARMLARHRTSYEQLVDAVLPQTRADYLQLVA